MNTDANSDAAQHEATTDRVVALLDANPSRTFDASIVAEELDIEQGTASDVLARMAKSGRISKVDRGQYRGLAHATPETGSDARSTHGATSAARVLAVLETLPIEWRGAAQVTAAMGLASDRKNAVNAALNRLAESGKVEKQGGSFRVRSSATGPRQSVTLL